MAQKGLIFTLDDEEDGPASLTRWAYDIDDAPIKGSWLNYILVAGALAQITSRSIVITSLVSNHMIVVVKIARQEPKKTKTWSIMPATMRNIEWKTAEYEKKRKTTRYSNKELPPKGTKDKIWFSEFPKATKALRTIQRKEEAIPCTDVTFKFQCLPGSTAKGGQLECAKLRANITELTDNNDITKLDDDKTPSIARDFYIKLFAQSITCNEARGELFDM
ncbi:hypothetical protein DSO57_1024450 [Entomophthora muscae]|uniref:Uncharacterized protein n=1 Tax=Entomophthora muscae TaxID=34485 RepID=A0ACC2S4T9_9FUNG|nr:hypothetical protein DSO57_1024450 [Entomophthora muscae]